MKLLNDLLNNRVDETKLSEKQISSIINESIKKGYVINELSPKILRNNKDVILNSIKINPNSIDYLDFEAIDKKDLINYMNNAINNGYEISKSSEAFLKKANTLIWKSITIYKFLLLHDLLKLDDMNKATLSYLMDKDIFLYCVNHSKTYVTNDTLFRERLNNLYTNSLKEAPTIETFKDVFNMVAERDWQAYKSNNKNTYSNVMGKIVSELRSVSSFDDAIENLECLILIENVLGDKYDLLLQAMQGYFINFHSGKNNNRKLIQYQDIIAKLCRLFVAICKEDFKKGCLEDTKEWLKSYFVLRLDHPLIKKKLYSSNEKQEFKTLYEKKDKDLVKKINVIKKNYSNELDNETINKMVEEFILNNNSSIESIIKKPFNYDRFIKFQKALKIINRLNQGYINYEDKEVDKYRDIIDYNDFSGEYVYNDVYFSISNQNEYRTYKRTSELFDNIKKDITSLMKNMNISVSMDKDVLLELYDTLPFTDEYFVFDYKSVMDFFDFKDLYKGVMDYEVGFYKEQFWDDETYNNMLAYVKDNGLIWLLLFMQNLNNDKLYINGINSLIFSTQMINMNKITSLAKSLNINSHKYSDLTLLNNLAMNATNRAIAILGPSVVEKLIRKLDDTNNDEATIVSIAEALAIQMNKKNSSTIPYVEGEYLNYRYSRYDTLDPNLLLSGINTGACFKVDGTDNDFLHYCALDKNGIILKITDTYGNFIARASGFRNGNSIYFNQLRTIYDSTFNVVDGYSFNEKEDIICTFKKACNDIIKRSQNNKDEVNKIDNIFVTRSYILSDYIEETSNDVANYIGSFPVENESMDWVLFVSETKDLQECRDINNTFSLDIGDYDIIPIASTKLNRQIEIEDIKFGDNKPLYKRRRNEIIITNNITSKEIGKLNYIRGIKNYYDGLVYKSLVIPQNSTLYIGDNWYIIESDGNIINECLLDYDIYATNEYNYCKDLINNDKEKVLKLNYK